MSLRRKRKLDSSLPLVLCSQALSLRSDAALAGVAESTLLAATEKISLVFCNMLWVVGHLGSDILSCILEVAGTVDCGLLNRFERRTRRLGGTLIGGGEALRIGRDGIGWRLALTRGTRLARLQVCGILRSDRSWISLHLATDLLGSLLKVPRHADLALHFSRCGALRGTAFGSGSLRDDLTGGSGLSRHDSCGAEVVSG